MRLFKRSKKKQSENKEETVSNQKDKNQLKLGEILFPAIKSKNNSKVLASNNTSNPILFKELFEDLIVVYYLDLGNDYQIASEETAKKYNATIDDFHEAAMRNLSKKVGTSLKQTIIDPPPSVDGGKSFTQIILDEEFDASLILVDELWSQFSEMLNDKIVGVSIPSRNVLTISTFSDDNISYRTMRLYAEHMYNEAQKTDNEITKDTFMWKDGKWHKFLNTQKQYMEIMQ